MTRLRYIKVQHYMLSQKFLCGTRLVQIVLYPNDLMYEIDTEKGTIKSGKANTLTSLKKKAKKAVIELGAVFCDEVRNRGKTEKVIL